MRYGRREIVDGISIDGIVGGGKILNKDCWLNLLRKMRERKS